MVLNISASVFTGVSNIITGMAIVSMLIFIYRAHAIGKHLDIKLWDRSSSLMVGITEICDYVVRAVALVCFMGLTAIAMSTVKVGLLVLFFSIYSLVILIAAYVIPMIPVTNQLREKKKQELGDLSRLIQIEYDKLIQDAKTGNDITSARLDTLLTTYQKVKKIRAFPPVRERTLNTAVIVTALTVLPTIIDLFLKVLK